MAKAFGPGSFEVDIAHPKPPEIDILKWIAPLGRLRGLCGLHCGDYRALDPRGMETAKP